MKGHTVKQLARLSGVSVRALHHYDAIGLLKPAFVGENRYRYYGRDELLRLQDILFHRELGVPLGEIAALLDQSGDRLALLEQHRQRLSERIERSRQLITTIDRTIAELKGNNPMKDKEFFRGFSPEKQAEYEQWLVDKYGGAARAMIDRSKIRFASLDQGQRLETLAEGGAAERALAEHFREGLAADDLALEPALARHHRWITKIWDREHPPMAYAGLAELYRSHAGFRERYEAIGAGFTDWLAAAMKTYAARLSE